MEKRYYFIIETIVILVIAGFFLYSAGLGPFQSKAANSIHQFIGDPNALVIFEKNNKNINGDSYDSYLVNGNRFTVDPDTGTVLSALFLSASMTQNKNLSLQQAEIPAREFAARHYRDFYQRNMQLTKSAMLDHGGGGIEYSYTWSEQSMNISIGNVVRVSVNTDGNILSYMAWDAPAPKVGPAKIGKDQAIETATRYVINVTRISNITSNQTSAQLTVMPDDRTRVVWNVELELRFMNNPQENWEDHRGGWVYIDAMTGDVVKYEPCM